MTNIVIQIAQVHLASWSPDTLVIQGVLKNVIFGPTGNPRYSNLRYTIIVIFDPKPRYLRTINLLFNEQVLFGNCVIQNSVIQDRVIQGVLVVRTKTYILKFVLGALSKNYPYRSIFDYRNRVNKSCSFNSKVFFENQIAK